MTETLQRLLSTTSLLTWLEVEPSTDRFKGVDELTQRALQKVFEGHWDGTFDPFQITGLSAAERAQMDLLFDLPRQQEKGAWFLPEQVRVTVKNLRVPGLLRGNPAYNFEYFQKESAEVSLHSSDALFTWTVLQDLLGRLMLPQQLRAPNVEPMEKEKLNQMLSNHSDFLYELGLIGDRIVRPFMHGQGWSRLKAREKEQVRQEHLQALQKGLAGQGAALYRAFRLRELCEKYREKSKKTPAKRTQVINRELGRVLSAYFDGDWLSFLQYIGAEPPPDEQVVTALPEPQLFTQISSKAQSVAHQLGLKVEDVERMLGTLWEGASVSPIERRVQTLKHFWAVFDEVHAQHKPGKGSLWGFVQAGVSTFHFYEEHQEYRSHPDIHRTLLPEDLNRDIFELWGTVAAPKAPGVLIDADLPHELMADTFGPALKVWHGIALTAWFICQGPASRTDMRGLTEYHEHHLQHLAEMGTPIHPELFEELIALEDQLHARSRKGGFSSMRDTVTRYRRKWAAEHLDRYLEACWKTPVLEAARLHNRLLASNGKTPSLRTFARPTLQTVNGWFGGNFAHLYAAISEQSPVTPVNRAVLPGVDRQALVEQVYIHLCHAVGIPPRPVGRNHHDEHGNTRFSVSRIADETFRYLQAENTLGHRPSKEDLSWHRRYLHLEAFDGNPVRAFTSLRNAIDHARRELTASRP